MEYKNKDLLPIEGSEETAVWEPRLEKLPDHVRWHIDKPMNRDGRRLRRVKMIKVLIKMADENGWQVLRRIYDDDSDAYREIYHIV